MKKVLIIGSGGREHALGWKISQSPEVGKVIYVPGNAGTQEGKGRNVDIELTEKERILELIQSENIDLTIIGPEQPLAEGLVNFLDDHGYDKVFGPTREASQLESDKFFSFKLMQGLGIPQAESIMAYNFDEAVYGINSLVNSHGIVLKARGLTSGKGVLVCDSKEESISKLPEHIKKYGGEILIAERLVGEEFSVFGISNGEKVFSFEISVQDHKRLLDGDNGPNTGGMGAYCPTPVASCELVKKISDEIMTPVILEMKKRGIEYKGFLYAGMIMTEQGPKVIEFNARFGDPECQPTMMMLKSDLYQIISQTLNKKEPQIKFNPGASCCVVLASQGYPENYQKGFPISGLEEVSEIPNVKVFHAGTKLVDGKIITNGGRVLGVTAYSPAGILEAQQLAYEAVSKLNIPGGFCYRKDIASKAIGI